MRAWDMPNGHRDALWHIFEAYARLEAWVRRTPLTRHISGPYPERKAHALHRLGPQ